MRAETAALIATADVDPFDAAARLERSVVLLLMKQPAGAFIEARAASVLNEDSTEALAAMVAAAAAMGQAVDAATARLALSAYRTLAARDPGNPALVRHAPDMETFKEKLDGERD